MVRKMAAPVFWLASYPRSGNTFLRTIIFNCFGVRSASVYRRDLGVQGVGELVGHIEIAEDGSVDFGDEPVRLIKTHRPPQDDRPAIYIVRDGRAAAASLHDFWNRQVPLRDIVEGRTIFGTWAGHLQRWSPRERPNTLFLRYEEVVSDIPGTVEKLAAHLRLEPESLEVPTRLDLAKADGRLIRAATSDKSVLAGDDLDCFWKLNGSAMRAYGYS
jgi:hypothetical protein